MAHTCRQKTSGRMRHPRKSALSCSNGGELLWAELSFSIEKWLKQHPGCAVYVKDNFAPLQVKFTRVVQVKDKLPLSAHGIYFSTCSLFRYIANSVGVNV